MRPESASPVVCVLGHFRRLVLGQERQESLLGAVAELSPLLLLTDGEAGPFCPDELGTEDADGGDSREMTTTRPGARAGAFQRAPRN